MELILSDNNQKKFLILHSHSVFYFLLFPFHLSQFIWICTSVSLSVAACSYLSYSCIFSTCPDHLHCCFLVSICFCKFFLHLLLHFTTGPTTFILAIFINILLQIFNLSIYLSSASANAPVNNLSLCSMLYLYPPHLQNRKNKT